MILLIGTRKGAFVLETDSSRETWKIEGPEFLGHLIYHYVQDPREPQNMLMAAKAGHLGPTLYRSTDQGKTWKEASKPPAFPAGGKLAVDHTFWLSPGHATERGVWWAGTSPPGLFRSDDHGETWEPVAGFNDHPMRDKWVGAEQEAPPEGARLHSINIDPRDPNHIYFGVSSGGVFETTDRGATWTLLNKGLEADFIPTPDPEFGQDPHCIRLHPASPDRLYQQNHCGIYRMDRPEGRWVRIGRNMPTEIRDIGFPIVLHPRDPDTAWVFPMDGTTVWPRTSPGGKPAVYVTNNAGKKWKRQDRGLPREQGWFTVKRQAMTADSADPVGLYFGTTSGEVWASRNEGRSWREAVRHLPHIYSLEVAVRD